MKQREEGTHMDGATRRKEMLSCLQKSQEPVSGASLAAAFHISRQVVVQDIALLRAQDIEIVSTNRGYMLPAKAMVTRVFAVCHSDDQIEEELNTIVDFGGCIEDVFIRHGVYGTLRAELSIRSRNQVKAFLKDLETGKSSPLKNITSGTHYHTVAADSEETLEQIAGALSSLGFLAG